MLETWTGEVVGRMHIAGISHRELADACGYANNYLSCVLHGKKGMKAKSRKGRKAAECRKSHSATALSRDSAALLRSSRW